MAGPFTIKVSPQTKRDLARARGSLGRSQVTALLLAFMDRQASILAGRISKGRLAGQQVSRRTGTLARSVTGRGQVIGSLPGFKVGVFRGPALAYAAVQEHGTKGKNPDSPYPTIRSKRPGGALAIPKGKALTPAGVARYASPRDVSEPLTFFPILKGRVIGSLVTKRSYDREKKAASRGRRTMRFEELDELFLLVKAVDVAPKFYLRNGLVEFLPEMALKLEEFVRSMAIGRKAG